MTKQHNPAIESIDLTATTIQDQEQQRRTEEYMRMRMHAVQEREEAVLRRERELNDREFLDRSGVKLGRRFSGHGRYDPPAGYSPYYYDGEVSGDEASDV
ncbi:hypothetical protein GJ744_012075 [Endocarpon pusillum]|uniref:Uncharacterized protein n=1 Tax=Endocarpon pusillum TaxID=364733 RepID=A0A8H7AED6_9EURO|nr:hypothetical protein GJ744_012075 [Endocarpon pusillum]